MTEHFQSIYWLFLLRLCFIKYVRHHPPTLTMKLIIFPLSGKEDGIENLWILNKLHWDLQTPFPKRQILPQVEHVMLVQFLGDTCPQKLCQFTVQCCYYRAEVDLTMNLLQMGWLNSDWILTLIIISATWEVIKRDKNSPTPTRLNQPLFVSRTLCVHFALKSEGLEIFSLLKKMYLTSRGLK